MITEVRLQRELDFIETCYLLLATNLATTAVTSTSRKSLPLNAGTNVHIRNLYRNCDRF